MPSKTKFSAAADRILDVAEQLVQTRGFNGFSYADIAKKLDVTKASIHYHFPSKEELGRALIVRYEAAFDRELEAIRQQTSKALERLQRYTKLYDAVMRNDRVCLCGMLAAEYVTLPLTMQNELRLFFKSNERWLAAVLEEGRRTGNLSFKGSAQERAGVLLGALEGTMLVSRSYSDSRVFRSAARRLLADLTENGAARPTSW
jgi:TetR/AcrR family transcriptional regulator, transcriptional repressor for nem operon